MPSDCIVPVVEITNIRDHPNAALLSIAEVLGYQVVNGLMEAPNGHLVREFVKGERDERGRRIPHETGDPREWEEVRYAYRYLEGSRVVYFPADTVLTDEWAEKFEVTHLLKTGNRVGRTRLRGEASFGLCVELPEGVDWELGYNAAADFSAVKWEPPADKVSAPDAAPYDSEIDPHFVKYTDIQNGLLLYDKFQEGEEVVATEKLHGCVQARTQITLVDGTRKSISKVSAGDVILGVDTMSGKIVPSTVTKKMENGSTKTWLKVTGNRRKAGRGSSFFAIHCTPEHRFWNPTQNCYVRAENLKKGDVVANLRSELGLTPVQEQVLLGKLLGDGSFHSNGISAHIAWGHKALHSTYVKWTAQGVGDLWSGKLGTGTSGYGTDMVSARTVNNAWILRRFEGFWPAGAHQKVVPAWVANELTPLSLAFLYMDDGSLGDAGDGSHEKALFALCKFTEDDCAVIQAGLLRLGIASVYYQSGDKHSRLRLNADAAERLFLLVAPYVPPVMNYKLPERYRGHNGWLPRLSQVYKPLLVEQTITSIAEISVKASGGYSTKHDLETTTSNYFANGILVHNSNCRIGRVNGVFQVGSRTTRKDHEVLRENSIYWGTVTESIEKLLRNVEQERGAKIVILYGEIYGQGVQSLHYGCNKKKGFRAFDIYVDGEFLDFHGFADACDLHGVERVPVLYRGPFDLEKIKEVSNGRSVLPGANNIREGVVVRTAKERRDPALGRVVLKFISTEYDLSKHKKKDTTDL